MASTRREIACFSSVTLEVSALTMVDNSKLGEEAMADMGSGEQVMWSAAHGDQTQVDQGREGGVQTCVCGVSGVPGGGWL